ncbi:DUF159-domain-containing protein [Setomelanomma holmii]|uniref:DUF159-domain-containing protein n=1 Tax=Setomelanomma holmii TaxID=210430 RepID=A0A9P4HMV5_9PLEO|nr:DUF159-domain-containing protein [Setomelanomma holmii]
MCGRYALALRPSEVRQQFEQSHMPVEEAPDDDDDVRQSYNFAPGYHGLIYRADGQEHGGATGDTRYKLQSMQWGLVPFWTKRNPDYGSKMKTINCRDDSLIEDRGMWTTMKKKKRCIIVAQGFYEWLKKGNQKVPHFTKRKDGQLMCFAGLWDCVQFEDSTEKLYTYTIITTDSNKQLSFLHDRMPVILENGSEAIRTWLDPTRTEWSKDLQTLLKPYEGSLECYPVSQEVGKVGNNSPSFLVPINSAENKNNIANFFGNQRKAGKSKNEEQSVKKAVHDLNDSTTQDGKVKIEHDVNETRATTDRVEGTEDNAPLPVPEAPGAQTSEQFKGIKRERSEAEDESSTADAEPPHKTRKPAPSASPTKKTVVSPAKSPAKKQGTRSATSNGSAAKTSKSDGSQKITSFFSEK